MQQLQGRTGPPRQASAPPGHRGTGHGQHRRPAHHRHLQLERVRDSSACTPIAGGCRVHLREETYAGSKGTVALLQRTHGHGRGTRGTARAGHHVGARGLELGTGVVCGAVRGHFSFISPGYIDTHGFTTSDESTTFSKALGSARPNFSTL